MVISSESERFEKKKGDKSSMTVRLSMYVMKKWCLKRWRDNRGSGREWGAQTLLVPFKN